MRLFLNLTTAGNTKEASGKRRRIVTFLCALMAATPLFAPAAIAEQPFKAINRLTVVPIGGGEFEVIGRAGAFKPDYWCAAGDYVRKSLALDWQTQIYAIDGISRSVTSDARSAVRFTLDPEQSGITPHQSNWVGDILTPGFSMRTSSAFGECEDRRFPFRTFN
ncbi:hypothetical protein [Phaeobacter sp.]|uniref:hypothetical protein n=1 Tax=Phaeobacter sp. TaxID=1902409 RepID=UPI0025F39293|nr:hypothetical protein [Phaeobacter sp.]